MSFIFIVIGFILLIKGADLFVDGCSNVAKALGIPSLIIGLTIVAFGTSAPEAAVSVTASIQGMNDIL
jgi:cation:H+ antiporter